MHNNKNKKLLITILLAVAFAAGSIAVGISASRLSNQLKANILKEQMQGAKKKKQRAVSALLAQLMVPQTVIDPLTICIYETPQNPEYKGEFVDQKIKIWAEEEGEFTASLYLKNTGNMPWFGDASGCSDADRLRLGTTRNLDRNSVFYNPADPSWLGPNRIAMMERRVDPGEIATFTFTSKTPMVTDIFREYFQPMVEGKKWLGAKNDHAQMDVYVGETPSEYEKSLFYLDKSGQASSLDVNGNPIIYIDISEQKLLLKIGETVVREYTVSTGTFKLPTPLGRFKILNKQDLRIAGTWPHYRMPKWQGFTKWGHGLHALPYLANDRGIFWNEALNHIGQRVSHGCVRMLPEDAEDLYNLVEIGTEVVIRA